MTQTTRNVSEHIDMVIGMVIEEYRKTGLMDTPCIGDKPLKQVMLTFENRD